VVVVSMPLKLLLLVVLVVVVSMPLKMVVVLVVVLVPLLPSLSHLSHAPSLAPPVGKSCDILT
jgi:hypothetical protein